MNILKKLNAKDILGGKIARPAEDDPEKILFDVYGLARRAEVVTTAFGDSMKFRGDFEAVNSETGEVFRSTVMYLPELAADMLANAIGEGANAVEFGFRIGMKPSDSPVGYEYTIKPLVETRDSDALESIRGSVKALAAPEPESKPPPARKKATTRGAKK